MTNKTILATIMILGSTSAMASGPTCPGDAHTTHIITTNKTATCVLSKLYEPSVFCLSDSSGNDISGVPFTVTPAQNSGFGMVVTGDDADFNMEYSLTCVVNDDAGIKSPKVIFAIGADGPADPDISVVNLYGAQGSWQATDVGENYSLVF